MYLAPNSDNVVHFSYCHLHMDCYFYNCKHHHRREELGSLPRGDEKSQNGKERDDFLQLLVERLGTENDTTIGIR